MTLNTDILAKIEAIDLKARAFRRYLHENPELSGVEFETSKLLKKQITELGLEIEAVPNSTGFIAILDTGRPGKTVGIRTDIDALPIVENPFNLTQAKQCVSKKTGVMHACGHDGHMTILMSSLRILLDLKDRFSGKVIFIFEEGEETNSGIRPMINFLKNKHFDAIYGTHVASFLPTGKVALDAGPVMASALMVDFKIHGQSGHGSRPDLSVNPIFGATQVLNGIASAWNNQIDVEQPVTLGITEIHGGQAYNVIPETVEVRGSLRFFDWDTGMHANDVLRRVGQLTAEAHNCTFEYIDHTHLALSPVVNDEDLAEMAQAALEDLYPGALAEYVNWYASETFGMYDQIAPILFAFVGIKNDDLGSGAEHHNEKFDFDDDALKYGIGATIKFVLTFLKG